MTNCKRAKSSMTPCYLRDGELAVGFKSRWAKARVCVGCDFLVELLREEQQAALKKAKV
jgi:hypothetical protein